MAATRNKPGPKPKIGPDQQKIVLGVVGNGGSLKDAADIIEVSRDTLRRAMRDDPQFKAGVRKAEKSGKLRSIKKVTGSKAWQAHAWMLERKYGSEFGRKDRHEHTGKDGRPMETVTRHVIDYDQIRKDLEDAVRSIGSANSRIPANGNGQSVHPCNAN